MNEFDGWYDVEDDYYPTSPMRVWDDCCCDVNYICRNCLSKW